MAGRYRPRRQFRFLLYQDIATEINLTDYILKLKQAKQFVTTVKNALRLYEALQKRDSSVLVELFPWIAERIKTPNTPPDSGDLEWVAERAATLAAQQVALTMPSLPATALVAAPIKPSATIKQAAPADASTIADNFLSCF